MNIGVVQNVRNSGNNLIRWFRTGKVSIIRPFSLSVKHFVDHTTTGEVDQFKRVHFLRPVLMIKQSGLCLALDNFSRLQLFKFIKHPLGLLVVLSEPRMLLNFFHSDARAWI